MSDSFLKLKQSLPTLGVGLGLRREVIAETFEHAAHIDWLEFTPENFMGTGGKIRRMLDDAAGRFRLASHGVNMSLGSTDPLNEDYLKQLKELVDTYDAPWFSDHLCFASVDGIYIHDLLPLPLTREAVRHMIDRIKRVREFIGRPILVENISYYMEMPQPEMSETDFITEILEGADCGLLLDVNNVFVNSVNHKFDPFEFLDKIPIERTVQVHVAGHKEHDGLVIDTHGEAVCEPVFELLEHLLKKTHVNAIMIERDQNFPDFGEFLAQMQRIRELTDRLSPMHRVHGEEQRSVQDVVTISARKLSPSATNGDRNAFDPDVVAPLSRPGAQLAIPDTGYPQGISVCLESVCDEVMPVPSTDNVDSNDVSVASDGPLSLGFSTNVSSDGSFVTPAASSQQFPIDVEQIVSERLLRNNMKCELNDELVDLPKHSIHGACELMGESEGKAIANEREPVKSEAHSRRFGRAKAREKGNNALPLKVIQRAFIHGGTHRQIDHLLERNSSIGRSFPRELRTALWKFNQYGIDVYSRMLHAGHQSALESIYPCCALVLGNERWRPLMRAHYESCPPRSHSIRMAGENFSDYLRKQFAIMQSFPFIAELAEFEWLKMEQLTSSMPVVEGSREAVKDLKQLARQRPVVNAALALRTFEYDVLDLSELVYGEDFQSDAVHPQRTNVVVYRRLDTDEAEAIFVSNYSARLIQYVLKGTYSYRQLMDLMAPEGVRRDSPNMVEHIVAFLEMVERLQESGIFAGSCPVPPVAS